MQYSLQESTIIHKRYNHFMGSTSQTNPQVSLEIRVFQPFQKAFKVRARLTSEGMMFCRVAAAAEKALLWGPIR